MFPSKESKKSANHEKMRQLLDATVLQAQYLHQAGEELQHTSGISCPR